MDAFLDGGELVEDSGVISDLDGGYDTASCTVLKRNDGNGPFAVGVASLAYPGLYLFGVSPKRISGGDTLVTLTYKGFYNRTLGGAKPPVDGDSAKFVWGCTTAQKTWPKGSLSGTVDGVNLANQVVNVLEPRETVKVIWVGSSKVDSSIFDTSSAKGSGSFGAIQDGPYSAMAEPTYNFPHGWVPTDSSSEQAYAGFPIWLNSVTYTGIPKFSAG